MQLKWHRTIYMYCKEVINTHTTLINNRFKCNLMSEQKKQNNFRHWVISFTFEKSMNHFKASRICSETNTRLYMG